MRKITNLFIINILFIPVSEARSEKWKTDAAPDTCPHLPIRHVSPTETQFYGASHSNFVQKAINQIGISSSCAR